MISRLVLILLSSTFAGTAISAPEQKIVDGITYQVVTTPADRIRIVWKDDAGRQMHSLPEAATYLQSKSLKVDTLMNGGIFEPGGIPSGLMVQEGKELRPVNRNDGAGNFFLKPNGVFLIGTTGASVIATEEYPPGGVKVMQAVQSGPLLLRRGKIHPDSGKTED